MAHERTSYRERTQWAGWCSAIFWASAVICCYPLLAGWDTDLVFSARLLIVALIVVFFLGLGAMVNGLTVLVQETRLLVHLGSVRLLKTYIPYSEIVSLESVHYRPLVEFGGWGLRGSGKRRAWTARGDQAVVLTMVDDRVIYIGSDRPHRLEERIRSAGSSHFVVDHE